MTNLTAGCVTAAVAVALILPTSWSLALADRMVPTIPADDRVLVIAFDERDPEYADAFSVPHRRAYTLEGIAIQALRNGATAVVFVGFDSLALRDGASDRAAVANSAPMQQIGIVPLLDVVLENRDGGLPVGLRYRVDELAGEFAGVGLPLVTDGSVVRAVPAAATVPTLDPGSVVRGGSDSPTQQGSVVLGLAVRSVLSLTGNAHPADGSELLVGDQPVPLEDGWLRLRWSDGLDGSEDAAVESAALADIGGIHPSAWAGRVVLIGTTDPGHTPYYDTPHGPMPEILVHANAVNTLLSGQYVRSAPPWTVVLAALVAAITVASAWRRSWWAAVAVAAVTVTGWLAAARLLAGAGWVIDPLRPPVAVTVTLVALGLAAAVRQLLQRRRLARLFSQYVPSAVARELVESGRAETARAGERLLVSVLFCDLRGFTPTAARLAPTDVRTLLDIYYEAYSQVVFQYGGTVLQYTGDEIFAVFGAPIPRTDHADAALACAREMQARQPKVNGQLREQGLPEIAFGIGLHTGPVVAAHVGSSIRRQYAIIGDPVNVGSRLCGQAREGQIVYSAVLAEHLSQAPAATPLDGITLKGIEAPLTMYRLEAPTSSVLAGSEDGP